MCALAVSVFVLLPGCILPEVPDEELETLPPPCGAGWVPTSDQRGCVRAFDAGVSDPRRDAETARDASVADASRDDAGSDPVDAGHDAGDRCAMPAGEAPPDASVPPRPVINEYVFKHQVIADLGTDYYEFVEVYGPPGADLTDLTVVVITSHSGSNPGTIARAVRVGHTNAGGFWRSCDGWRSTDDAFPQASATMFLVRNFTGAAGNDLDSGNDGVLDVTPWDEILDAVAFEDSAAADDVFYTTVRLVYGGFPGHEIDGSRLGASRVVDGFDTDAQEDWRKNHYTGTGFPGVTGSPRPTEAYNTPGAPNRIQ